MSILVQCLLKSKEQLWKIDKDKEAPVEDRDSNLEENVPNISENEVAAIQENLSNDQNIQDEKRAATIQEKE